MNRTSKIIFLFLMLAFAAIQTFASFSKSNIYPFSPYRMFSRHWPSGVQMDRVRYRDDQGVWYRPWDVLEGPFFLTNHLSFVTFLDPSSDAQKEAICDKILWAVASKSVEVVSDVVKFERIDGQMREFPHKEDVVHVCLP